MYYPVADPGISEPGGALQFLGSGDCFDPFSNIHHVFVVRVDNKTHIVNNCVLIKIKVLCMLCSFQMKGGRGL